MYKNVGETKGCETHLPTIDYIFIFSRTSEHVRSRTTAINCIHQSLVLQKLGARGGQT